MVTPPPVFTRPDVQFPAVRTAHRRQLKRRHTKQGWLGHLVKVAFGGAAGCVLGVLLVWWGFGTDPFGIAPQVAKTIPEVVPVQLR